MRRLLVLLFALTLLLPPGSAGAALAPGGTFIDDDGNTHEGTIEAIVAEAITLGCDAVGPRYCPSGLVTRAQMASFLAGAFDLPSASRDYFADDDGSVHEDNINRSAEAGITLGVDEGRFDPTGRVTREQMASFLVGALGLEPLEGSRFTDVSGVHEPNVNALAEAEVTLGCDPSGTLYCPKDAVRRDQMASFLARALGLDPLTVPPRESTTPPLDCPTDGSWTGTTSQGHPIAFQVAATGVCRILDGMEITRSDPENSCPPETLTIGTGDIAIVDGRFSAGSGLIGEFPSPTQAKGTYEDSWIYYYTRFDPVTGGITIGSLHCEASVTWTATP